MTVLDSDNEEYDTTLAIKELEGRNAVPKKPNESPTKEKLLATLNFSAL